MAHPSLSADQECRTPATGSGGGLRRCSCHRRRVMREAPCVQLQDAAVPRHARLTPNPLAACWRCRRCRLAVGLCSPCLPQLLEEPV